MPSLVLFSDDDCELILGSPIPFPNNLIPLPEISLGGGDGSYVRTILSYGSSQFLGFITTSLLELEQRAK